MDDIEASTISRLEYTEKSNTRNVNVCLCHKALVKLSNSYVDKLHRGKSKAFQTSKVQVPGGIVRTWDSLSGVYDARTNFTTVSTSCDPVTQQQVDTQYKHLFANTSTTGEDIYLPSISEIAEA